MGSHDTAGRPRKTAGVIGALELWVPGEGDVLPHERTMSKPKDDRLNLLRACRANLSPVWGLSLAEGLSQLCELPGPPTARGTDEDGVHHRLWRITRPGVVAAIAEAGVAADEGAAARLDAVLTSLPPHDVVYQHGVDHTLALIDKGEAQAAVLLRATTVEQIASAARARRRMPAKSTFFYPKPRTGL